MSVEYLFVSEKDVCKLSAPDFREVSVYRNTVVGCVGGGVIIPVRESGSVVADLEFPEGANTKVIDVHVPLSMDRKKWAEYLGVEKKLVDGELVPYNQDKKVVILNAPPNSGKDFFVEQLKEKGIDKIGGLEWHHQEMKSAPVEMVKLFYNLTDDEVELLSSRENKEIPSSILGGKSWREAVIHVSEDVVKPVLGKDVFGVVAAKKLKYGINIFTDGGFEEEIPPIVEEVGEYNIIIIKIEREGSSFEGDSRNWLDIEGVSWLTIKNHGDDSFVEDILFAIDMYLGEG